MTVREAVEARRSIRAYQPEAVADTDLKLILEAGRLAPSGCNLQPWRFVVTTDPALKARLAEEGTLFDGNRDACSQAPAIVTFVADLKAHCRAPEMPESLKARFDGMDDGQLAAYAGLNIAIALAQMNLQATELGYGMCWMMAIEPAKCAEILGVPADYRVVAITPLGKPAEAPEPRPRLTLEEVAFADVFGGKLSL
jgi:nitroreductase